MINVYLVEYDDLILESYICEIYEGIDLSKFKDVFKKIGNEISNNFKFIGSFGMVITLFFPLVDTFMKNMHVKVDINPTNVIFATIGALAILIDNNKDKLKWVLNKLGDRQWDSIIHELANSFKSIKDLFTNIASQLGKVIKSFTDMLSYTMMFVPFLKLVLDFSQHNVISPKDFIGMGVTFGTGVAIIAGKNILEYLINSLATQNKKFKNLTLNA